MEPKAKIDCQVNGIFYVKGETIKVNSEEQLIKLNEKGFIEPMTMRQIQDYFNKPKLFKKEEE